jgi:hypothetical protein
MENITFTVNKDFAFAGQFLEQATSILKYQTDQETQTHQIYHPIIARLLKNVAAQAPTVLPYEHLQYDEWVLIAPTRHQLDRLLSKVNRFVGATYGVHPGNNPFPTLYLFDENKSPSYSSEYYAWHSPKKYRNNILSALEMWLDLEEGSPDLRLLTPANFRDVFKDFQSALAAHNWNNAENALSALRRNRLTSPKNISFLSIELLAQKQQYEKIWGNRSSRALAKGNLPRRIKVAFLKAFHHQQLLANEQNGEIEQNLAVVKSTQTQFEKLFNYREDIIDDIAVRVFAYLAAVNQTPETLEIIYAIDNLSEDTQQILEKLAPYFHPVSEQTNEERFKELSQNQDFSNAYSVASKIDDELIRIPAQMQCLSVLKDSQLAKSILEEFYNLDPSQKNFINNQNPYFEIFLENIHGIIKSEPEIYTDWTDWFEAALTDPDADRLSESLDYLEENTDKEYWNRKNVKQLRDYLGVITFDKAKAPPSDLKIISSSYFQQAMFFLLSQFVKDDQFPRESIVFGEIYSAFYNFALHVGSQKDTEILLRLVDDKITRNPKSNLIRYQELIEWLGTPRLAVQETWLEIVELGIHHGLGKEHIYQTYLTWIQILLDSPLGLERANIEVLLSLSQWFGEYAQAWSKQLEDKLFQSTSDSIDPLTLLPDGYRIIIYTLDESSARRVQEILNNRNRKLDITLCHAKTMSTQVERLTENSDMHVLVTTCMKHSLYYGISDYIDVPIYPQSRGSSSILRAIENRASEINI